MEGNCRLTKENLSWLRLGRLSGRQTQPKVKKDPLMLEGGVCYPDEEEAL